MMVEIRMPEVAADMTEADVVGWLAAEGDPINEGEILFEIETDKSTVEIEAPATGILKEIRVPAGQAGVAVGALLAVMETADEARAKDIATSPTVEPELAEPPSPKPETAVQEAEPKQRGEEEGRNNPPEATALARRIAQKAGLDVTGIRGTGARGRVLRTDVEDSLAEGSNPLGGKTHEAAPEEALVPSLSSTDSIHLSTACRFDPLIRVVATLNRGNPEPPIPASAGLVRAIAMAVHRVGLPRTPEEGGQDEHLTRLSITDGSNSSTSLLLGAEKRGLGSIAAELASSEPAEASSPGGSGEIAVFHALESGVDRIEARPRAGQACAFSIGTVRESPIVEEGELGSGTMVEIQLCADAGCYSPETATLLLGCVRQLLESPTQMAL